MLGVQPLAEPGGHLLVHVLNVQGRHDALVRLYRRPTRFAAARMPVLLELPRLVPRAVPVPIAPADAEGPGPVQAPLERAVLLVAERQGTADASVAAGAASAAADHIAVVPGYCPGWAIFGIFGARASSC